MLWRKLIHIRTNIHTNHKKLIWNWNANTSIQNLSALWSGRTDVANCTISDGNLEPLPQILCLKMSTIWANERQEKCAEKGCADHLIMQHDRKYMQIQPSGPIFSERYALTSQFLYLPSLIPQIKGITRMIFKKKERKKKIMLHKTCDLYSDLYREMILNNNYQWFRVISNLLTASLKAGGAQFGQLWRTRLEMPPSIFTLKCASWADS